MALQLTKSFANGSSGNYWKITKIIQYTKMRHLEYVIECFKDSTFKNGESLDTLSFIFSDVGGLPEGPYPYSQLLVDNTIKVGYDLIKVRPEFSGSGDV